MKPTLPHIYFAVTNDLSYDQRMIRICTSLAEADYKVTLVGRKRRNSIALQTEQFAQKRLRCWSSKGKLFYAEYNARLFFFLLFKEMDGICAVDLDTILPCLSISKIKKIPRIYDAHELFCEMKEIVTRPAIYKVWKKIERYAVPQFKYGYTVCAPLAEEFKNMYNVQYDVIRNLPRAQKIDPHVIRRKAILCQGAVNEGRSFESLIPAMTQVDATLTICGDGNFMSQAKQLVKKSGLEDKITFTGMVSPQKLREMTGQFYIGITLVENNGKSYYLSLANRFFDYVQAGTPQLCVGYPSYKMLNNEFNVAVLIEDLSADNIAKKLNEILSDEALWSTLHDNALQAAKKLHWAEEEKILLRFYKNIFG